MGPSTVRLDPSGFRRCNDPRVCMGPLFAPTIWPFPFDIGGFRPERRSGPPTGRRGPESARICRFYLSVAIRIYLPPNARHPQVATFSVAIRLYPAAELRPRMMRVFASIYLYYGRLEVGANSP